MEVVYRCCCGIDVHKKVIVACLVNGGEQELREFGTTTSEIKTLANWLTESGCEMIAMESTGVFWKPLYNLFELMDLDAMIVNAAHMKALPGRKTDVKDAEWIADLLRHGLLKASYIPNREQRELREITRYRKSLTEERCREVNRLQKILEGANIKLDFITKKRRSCSSLWEMRNAACAVRYSASSAMRSCMTSPKSAVKEKMKYSKTAGSASIGSASSEKGKPISP